MTLKQAAAAQTFTTLVWIRCKSTMHGHCIVFRIHITGIHAVDSDDHIKHSHSMKSVTLDGRRQSTSAAHSGAHLWLPVTHNIDRRAWVMPAPTRDALMQNN